MNDQEHKCKCDFRIRMLGDGCRYCQPQEYIERLHDTMDGMVHTDCFELTDEEIYRLLADSIWAVGLNTDCLDEQNWADGITVARAILRKAQEK